MLSTNNVQFRPAEPHDAEKAAPLILSSGPAAFHWLFTRGERKTAVEFLRTAFSRGGSLFGFQNHTLGTIDGEVVATGAFYTHRDAPALNRGVALEVLRYYGPLVTPVVLMRGLRIERSLPPPTKGRLYIAHLGVNEEWRGHGIGEKLVRFAFERAQREHLIPSLDVALTNPRAQSLYERLGFRVITERKGPCAEVPAHRYMEADIADRGEAI